MTGHTATGGENAGCYFHAMDVFGRGLGADQDHGRLAITFEALYSIVGSKHNLAHGSARGRRQTGGQHFDFALLFVETRNQEVV